MKLIEIKRAIAAYLEKTEDEIIVNDVDLGLLAMNQVRQQAELMHDFEFSRKLCQVSVNGVTGGSLESAVLYGTSTAVSVKTVLDVGLFDEAGNFVAADWTTVADSLNRQRKDRPFGGVPRYPTDGEAVSGLGLGSSTRFTFSGSSVYVFPKNTAMNYMVGVEGYTFMADWVDADLLDTATDVGAPWNTKGSQYLLWQSVIHLNQLYKQFVFRQEGNLPPPEKLADAGLQSLIQWDIFRFEGYRTHVR